MAGQIGICIHSESTFPPNRLLLVSLVLLFMGFARMQAKAEDTASAPTTAKSANVTTETPEEHPGVLHRVLLYFPDRLLDVIDIVRLRARVGPGVAAGVRATTAVDLYMGTYVSVYAGLPGPRMRRMPKSPVGLESYNGVEVSVANATASGGIGPGYSPTEFGVSLHPLILGFDIGLDPYEALDFAAGLFMVDLRHDDL
jgi:hypothetical protein